MAKKQTIKIKDPEVLQYLQILQTMGRADPENASQYLTQAMGVYTSYLDSQKPENKVAKIYGADIAPALLGSGLKPEALADERYADFAKPLVTQFMTLRNKYTQGTANKNEIKKMTALEGLINNPSRISEYQYYKPDANDKQGVIDSNLFRKSLQQTGKDMIPKNPLSWLTPGGFVGNVGKSAVGLAAQGFAQPSDLAMKNNAFKDITGDIGNINPLQ